MRRLSVVAALVLPLCLISLSFAQPGMQRPPIGGRGGIGGAGGLPGGGIGGRGGIPGGGIGGAGAPPGAGIGGGGLPGIPSYEFTCTNCGKKVTSGISPLSAEHIANCPHCGVRFGNTAAGNAQSRIEDMQDRARGIGGGWDARGPGAGANPPGMNTPPVNGPAANPGDNGNVFKPTTTSSSSPPPALPTPTTTSRASLVILLVFVFGGLLLLFLALGVGVVIWMVRTAPSGGGERVVRRRPRAAASRYEQI